MSASSERPDPSAAALARFWRDIQRDPEADETRRPAPPAPPLDPLKRRQFLELMGASLALATGACTRQPDERIVPYVRAPENILPGRPLFYATATLLGGFATGVLVETHMGRPTKVEGNPEHPVSLGATTVFDQAAVLDLYDPARSRAVTHLGEIDSYGSFVAAMQVAALGQRARRGAGLRILTGAVTSPSLAAQIEALLASMPLARWHSYEPAGRDGAIGGSRLAFGADLHARHHVGRASVIFSLDADFLSPTEGDLRQARDWAHGRKPGRAMNRLYVVESTPTITGARADHRSGARASEVEAVARALAVLVGVDLGGAETPLPDSVPRAWLEAAARDLAAHRGTGLVIPGPHQPAIVHAIAHAMNDALGAVGVTVDYVDPLVLGRPIEGTAQLRELSDDMAAGAVQLLLILGANPVYTAPADLAFADRLARVPLRVHLGMHHDETAALCHWHVPELHAFESWGDARAADGTVTLQQPLLAPLHVGRSPHEVLATLTDRPEQGAHDLIREHWRTRAPFATAPLFDDAWKAALHDGFIRGSAPAPRAPVLRATRELPRASTGPHGIELSFRPCPSIFDGRFATNAWLQELPRPLTKLTWDNAALIAPHTAARLGLETEDVIAITVDGRTVRAAVWVMPGQPEESVTIHLGYGRTRAGAVGNDRGFDAYRLRTSLAPWFVPAVTLAATGDRYRLATTQLHASMEGRKLARSAPAPLYHADPGVFAAMEPHGPSPGHGMYPPWPYATYAWGMSIDLNTCLGCNACVVACQAENNIPVVGKEEVLAGREMHWLRIDRYYEGPANAPQTLFQPVPCMHCETAPCEVVCPVAATVHSNEGLNDMVYNRCVGTRYCSNNCPYKVRRFNFFQYSRPDEPTLGLQHNPDVTVRTRGVMEKCTYCTQRISHARITAKKEARPIRDGEVMTACQAACPVEAIVFGDLNDRTSAVALRKAEPRDYALLAHLNTRPRTTYLGHLSNKNPDIEEG